MGEIRWILAVGSALIAFKCLLIPAYTSTDFEVHRNWMAVTWHRPIGEWYTEATSEWTLDYPPFFAFFELALARAAHFLGIDEILEISSTPKMSPEIRVFQRLSVIFTDVFYILVCALYSFRSHRLTARIPLKLRQNAREACFVLLTSLQALLLVDSVHFQYNSMLTAFFLLSLYFVDSGRLLAAAFTFSVLLNFKHIYVYYAFGYVFYYMAAYFQYSGSVLGENVPKALLLAVSLLVPFALSLLPFFIFGGGPSGSESLRHIAVRLFPVSRGLTHAFWAPNFWALYNFADLILYRILTLFKVGNFQPPTYTSGLVQEYAHSVLPNVSTLGTLCLVTVSSVVVLIGLVIRRRKDSNLPDFSLFAVLAALSFFYFGYHVHEKAIILVAVPMTVFAIKDPKYLPHLVRLSTIASFSLFPLLFTPLEIPLKYAICAAYFLLQLVVLKRFTRISLWDLLPTRHLMGFAILALAEVYNTFVHQYLFSTRLPFAPLMAISVLNAVELTDFFGSLIWSTFLDGLLETTWHKATCRLREQLIIDATYSVQTVDDVEEVQLVAGVDVSASKTNQDLVVVSLSVWKFPQCEHVATVADTRCLRLPYIPQYLAVREAQVVAEFVKQVLEERPHFIQEVAEWRATWAPSPESRQLESRKNLALHDVYETVGMANKTRVDEFVDSIREAFKSNKTPGFVPFDIVDPVKLNVIRMGGSMSGVFVSAGYGIELDLATRISIGMLANNTTCEPIRAADLSSRERVRHHFDGEKHD
ncbi:unnamed protein product [Caenorhabditis sp. 36 PRJEB53466]|nr:unnamed protein product [Caenorhabditis sp. 36 PRJEB53466]